MNQLNELGEKRDSDTLGTFSGDTLNGLHLKASEPTDEPPAVYIPETNSDTSNRTEHEPKRPKPQKRSSIRESRSVNGLFRLSAAKDAFDKVTKKVMSSECKADAYLRSLKSNLKSNLKSECRQSESKQRESKRSERSVSRGELRHLKGDQQLSELDGLRSDLKVGRVSAFESDDQQANRSASSNVIIVGDHTASGEQSMTGRLCGDGTSIRSSEVDPNEAALSRIMPEPLFTELELDELCNRSLICSSNASSNSSNSSIDCKPTESANGQLNYVKKLVEENRLTEKLVDRESDRECDREKSSDRDKERNRESDRDHRADKRTIWQANADRTIDRNSVEDESEKRAFRSK